MSNTLLFFGPQHFYVLDNAFYMILSKHRSEVIDISMFVFVCSVKRHKHFENIERKRVCKFYYRTTFCCTNKNSYAAVYTRKSKEKETK